MNAKPNPIERWLRDCLHAECGGDPVLLEKVGSQLLDKNSQALVVGFAKQVQSAMRMMRSAQKETER